MTIRVAELLLDGGGGMLICHVPEGFNAEEGSTCVADVGGILEHGRVRRFQQAKLEPDEVNARLLRRSTEQDVSRAKLAESSNLVAKAACLSKARKFYHDMHFVRVRYSFDRSTVEVMFTADGRIDFREMVRELARELRARVQMRQVGVRDGAAVTGGLGSCGRALCCSTWLTKFDAVNIKHAKVQNMSMNPAAITGMCGRLKCCLRFELDADGQPMNLCKGGGCSTGGCKSGECGKEGGSCGSNGGGCSSQRAGTTASVI